MTPTLYALYLMATQQPKPDHDSVFIGVLFGFFLMIAFAIIASSFYDKNEIPSDT